jgi:hypothetical protein
MSQGTAQLRGAVAARDAAVARVRRSTAIVAAGCVALGGTFAALASASTHARHHPTRAPARTATRRARTRVVAPPPPLVAVSQAAAPATPPASTPPPVAAPPAAPPVAVSGGS